MLIILILLLQILEIMDNQNFNFLIFGGALNEKIID